MERKIKAKYFTYDEMIVTNTGIENSPMQGELDNLQLLVTAILDPLREKYGKPISVNSAYRNPLVNREVGGSATSHHVLGMAADITTHNKDTNKILHDLIRDNFKFTQLINERDYSWVHISYDAKDLKCQQLKM